MSLDKRKVVAFIDGFNLYHSIDDLGTLYNHLKWLNLWKLCETSCTKQEELVGVKYFTAIQTTSRRKKAKHLVYIRALEYYGVEIIKGRFARTNKRHADSKVVFPVLEEKETDVNIAIQMVKGAIKNDFDTAFLITADSDQVPTIKLVKDIGKQVRILIPVKRSANELKMVSDRSEQISIDKLSKCLLPGEINSKGGRIVRPDEYRKP
jgi:uncharacterized LabA/DUF88 family protein